MIFIYRFFINFLFFISPIIIFFRIINKKEDPKRFKEKLGFFGQKRDLKNLIWFHVASVGELLSIIPLIEKLEKNKQIKNILVTSTTLSSANLFKKLKLKKSIHKFFPIDTNFLTEKFLNHWNPKLAVFVESEIWPNMLLNLKKKSIKHVLLNARLTNKSFNRWSKINFFSKSLFSNLDVAYPQNKETKVFLKKLGCKKIKKIGNLKFTNRNKKLNNFFNYNNIVNKKILCASSTHYNEELIIAKLHSRLEKKLKNLLTIIIPRHIDRCKKIIKSINKLNLPIQLHSENKKIKKNTKIYLVDSYGETEKFFKISKVVFLGGSLINHGGQNPLEAARLGCKIIHGKYIQNFKEIYSLLRNNKQSIKINSQYDLDYIVKKSLNDRNKSSIFLQKLNKIGKVILEDTNREIIKLIQSKNAN